MIMIYSRLPESSDENDTDKNRPITRREVT